MDNPITQGPKLVKTGSGFQVYVPVVDTGTLYRNAPNLTFAGGKPIYAQQNTNVTFIQVNLTSGTLILVDEAGNDNILNVENGELFFNGTLVGGGGGGNPGLWSNFPALKTVDMVQYSMKNLNSIFFKDNNTNVLTINENNELTYNGSVLSVGGTTPAEWSNYPAVSNIDVANKKLLLTDSILFKSEIQNILTINESNQLTYNGDILATGNTTPATWSEYEAIATINANNQNIINANTIFFNSADNNNLTINGQNELTYNGQVLQTGAVDLANWSNFPAVSTLQMGQHGINIAPLPVGYTNSRLDTNLQIGSGAFLVNPSVNIFSSGVSFGNLANPVGSFTVDSLLSINLRSAEGLNIEGGFGITLIGGGNITAIGSTIELGAGLINMNAGTINNEGGTINFAGGEIFLGAGLLTMLSGQMTLGGANITMDTGALEVLSGQIIVGTIGSSTSQLGIKCYGGGIGVSKIGSVDGTKTLEINNVASINGQPYVLPEGGKFMITAVANSYTISIPGFTASGLINLTWVGSGGPQWFSSVLSGSGSAIINVGRPGVIGESIIWSVINY